MTLRYLPNRVRKLSHVITPTMQIDGDRDVEREYRVRVFADFGVGAGGKA